MKKIYILILSIIFVLVILSSLVMYSISFTKDMDLDHKFIKEMQYISNQLISVMGQFNGISTGDYAIQLNASRVSPENDKQSKNEKNGGKEINGEEKKEGNKERLKYNINDDKPKEIDQHQNDILSQDGKYETNWQFIGKQIENLYQIWDNICLDLLNENIDSKQITIFTDYLNNTLKNIKDKNKETSMNNIVELYKLLPEYLKIVLGENDRTIAFEVKANILEAYSNVSNDKWEKAVQYIEEAEIKLRNILNNESENPILLNQSYIIVNELKKAAQINNKEVFFIQYKNLISRIQLVM